MTDANALVRDIHDRMPAVLSPEDYDAWLDPAAKDTERLRAMLRPADPEAWTRRKVSRKVNNHKNDSPELIEDVAAS